MAHILTDLACTTAVILLFPLVTGPIPQRTPTELLAWKQPCWISAWTRDKPALYETSEVCGLLVTAVIHAD